MRFSLLASGSITPLARNTPQNVATKAAEMPWPSNSGWSRWPRVAIRPITAPMMPNVGAKIPYAMHQSAATLCRAFIVRMSVRITSATASGSLPSIAS